MNDPASFTEAARRTANDTSKRIVLIDGEKLTRMVIQYGVGCRIEETLYIKRVDEEFFDQ
jgi:restriction system protein